MPALRTRMTARDAREAHRVSSPLELLFDLTFVVAIAQIAAQLAHAVEAGHGLVALGPFCMVFFAIWWAWMNFTWFASAYDTDDVPYRLLTLLQMGGVLVLAAGVPAAFESGNYLAITIGYAIMRVGLVSLWARVAVQDPNSRRTAVGYVVGISGVQALWLLRLLLPGSLQVATFVVLAVLEVVVPIVAEGRRHTSWHPHHIAERYGLLTIILLGESVLASTAGVQAAVTQGITVDLVVIAIAGLVLLFALWWIYFSEPSGDGLEQRSTRSYIWGYIHYGIFASLAAIGAGLEVAVDSTLGTTHADAAAVSLSVAIPVAIFLVLLWAAHVPIVERAVVHPAAILVTVVVILAAASVAGVLGIAESITVVALAVSTLLAVTLFRARTFSADR